jgi:hypothetical protein
MTAPNDAAPHPADGDDTETIEIKDVAVLDNAVAMRAVDRAAIDSQVATAKEYPRSVDKCLKAARSLATLDQDTAESMFYTLERGKGKDKKFITGPSVRLAEVMAYSWGNLRVDAAIESEDRTHLTAVGTCFDVEKNVAVRVRVRRRCTTKQGHKYGDDMMTMTANAAIAIARRNAIVAVIPRVYIEKLFAEAQQAALGKGTIAERRQRALKWFGQLGMKQEQVFQILGVNGIEDVDDAKLIVLTGLKTAIQDGETTVEKLLKGDETEDATATASLNTSLGVDAPAKAEPAPAAAAAEPKKPIDNTNRSAKPCEDCGAKPGELHASGCPFFDDGE